MCAMWKRTLYIASCTYNKIPEHPFRNLLTNQPHRFHFNVAASSTATPTATATATATVTPCVNIRPSAECNDHRYMTHSHCVHVDHADTDADADADAFADVDVESALTNDTRSVIEPLANVPDVSHVGPALDHKSFNFAAFANQSAVIQQFIHIGVDFHLIETREKLPTYLLDLNFETDVKPFIRFLHDNGVPPDQLARFFTINPWLMRNRLDDLHVRVNYLQCKKFTDHMIGQIVTKEPRWLNYSTVAIDQKLGFFQRNFQLAGYEVRRLASHYPKVILLHNDHINEINFHMKHEVGFTLLEYKQILMKQPYVWCLPRDVVQKRTEFLTNEMKIPLSGIVHDPCGLVNRPYRLRTRHLFLQSLGKAQYDPTKPNYVSMKALTHGDDATFCQCVAKTTINTFNTFLKTL